MPVFEGAFQNIIDFTAGDSGAGPFERTFLARVSSFNGVGFNVTNEPIGSCTGSTCDLFGGTSTYSTSSQLVVQVTRIRDYYEQVGYDRCLFDEVELPSAELIYTGPLVTNSRIDLKYSGAVTIGEDEIVQVSGDVYLTGCENIDTGNPFYEDYPVAQQEFTWTGGSTTCCQNGRLYTTGEQIQSPAIPRMPFRDIPPFEYEGVTYKIVAARLTIAYRNGYPEYFYEFAVTHETEFRNFYFSVNAGLESWQTCGGTDFTTDAPSCSATAVDLTDPEWEVADRTISYLDLEARGSASDTRFPDSYSDVRVTRNFGDGTLLFDFDEDPAPTSKYAAQDPRAPLSADVGFQGSTVYDTVQIGYTRSLTQVTEGPIWCRSGSGRDSCFVKTNPSSRDVSLIDTMTIADLPNPFYKGGSYRGWWEPVYFVSVESTNELGKIGVRCRKVYPQPPPP